MSVLTRPHEPALAVLFAELAAQALEVDHVVVGTPGCVTERSNAEGTRFWVRRYSDAAGARREQYLGKVGDSHAAAKVDDVRNAIEATMTAIGRVRLLARAGYALLDKKAFHVVASLHNHELFRAGAFLVGSHAYGALLNGLGVRAAAYATEDVDLARREALALPGGSSLIDMLRETGIPFVEVPQLDRRSPPSSFKQRGASRFRVDLLVPTKRHDYPTVPVPELKAYATGLPYFSYLLGASQMLPLLSTHGVVAVRVPTPERYAVHKLIVSQLRGSTSSKTGKDLHQAATLIDALADSFPGAIADAVRASPRSTRQPLARGIAALRAHLPGTAVAAWESLDAAI